MFIFIKHFKSEFSYFNWRSCYERCSSLSFFPQFHLFAIHNKIYFYFQFFIWKKRKRIRWWESNHRFFRTKGDRDLHFLWTSTFLFSCLSSSNVCLWWIVPFPLPHLKTILKLLFIILCPTYPTCSTFIIPLFSLIYSAKAFFNTLFHSLFLFSSLHLLPNHNTSWLHTITIINTMIYKDGLCYSSGHNGIINLGEWMKSSPIKSIIINED
jgi:hypothetical protein